MKTQCFLAAILITGCGATARADVQRLVVDPAHSRIEVAVHATVDSFTARLTNYEANLEVDFATARITGAALRFRFMDLKTGKTRRDREMHEWQHTAEYPDGEFTLSELIPEPDGRYSARGVLRLHGHSNEIRFPIAVTTDRTLYAVDGEAPIDTRDFGLAVIRKLALLKVDPVVGVRFHLQASLPHVAAMGGAR